MPYIKQERREAYHYPEDGSPLEIIAEELAACKDIDLAGDLNFLIAVLVNRVITRKGKSYSRYNAIIGALECCKQELYRRHIAPYEDQAIERNGDV